MQLEAAEALATEWGRVALPGFFAGLAGALLGMCALWWALRRYAVPREHSRLPPWAFLGLHLLLGFALIFGAAAVFAQIAERLGTGEALGRLDQAFTASISTSTPAQALRVFAWLTHFGDRATQWTIGIGVTLLLLAARHRELALGWAAAVAGNGMLNTALKNVFERSRPIHDHGLVTETGWSFPSGHSSGSVVIYGMLAYLAIRLLPDRWQLPAVLAATMVAYTTGCSRVFLQVHFASDVIAGFCSGTAWLAVCIGSVELLRYARGRRQQR